MRTTKSLTRRRLLQAGAAVLGGAGASALYALRIEPHWLRVVRHELPIRGLPAGLVGKTLAQISDLHVGPIVDPGYLSAALELLSNLGPDLVVVTGDFMHCDGAEQVDQAARVFRHLSRPPLGCFGVLGNHDYGRGWRNAEAADRLHATLQRQGVTLLRNASRIVEGLQIIGLDDFWSPYFAPQPLFRDLDWERPTLALCHNPDVVDLPIWEHFHGWTLSGHTHGGQCKPPFLPPPILPVKNRRYTRGVFPLEGGRALHINPGLGYLKRVRFNVRPEITLFRLVAA